jgi:hypothetical protein
MTRSKHQTGVANKGHAGFVSSPWISDPSSDAHCACGRSEVYILTFREIQRDLFHQAADIHVRFLMF